MKNEPPLIVPRVIPAQTEPGAINPVVVLVIVHEPVPVNPLPVTITEVTVSPTARLGGDREINAALTGICSVEKIRINVVASRSIRNSGLTLRFLDDLALRLVNVPNFPWYTSAK